METLQVRLDVVQTRVLDLIENNSDNLEDQILYWTLIREENVLLNYARRQGLMRIGPMSVPPRGVSEARGKVAIEMQLVLMSLKKTVYAREPWTLSSTSYEAWNSAPMFTLKKSPSQVELHFDGSKEDAAVYTVWGLIYYQKEDNGWDKVVSLVDYYGVYYVDYAGVRTTYVDFEEEARKYGARSWEVLYNNEVISPVSSSRGSGGSAEEVAGETGEATRRRGRPDTLSDSSVVGTSSSAKKATVSGHAKHRYQRQAATREIARRSLGLGEGERGSTGRGEHPESSAPYSPPSAAEVGRRHTTVRGTGRGRLGQLLAEARDPPVLLFAGGTNALKCFRHRIRRNHSGLYRSATTGFRWQNSTGDDTGGISRMLVAFVSESQRQEFLSTVSVPSSFSVSKGNLDSL